MRECVRTDADALDLQSRIDEREREYRDVLWAGGWAKGDDGKPKFRLTNEGATEARSVTVVYEYENKRYVRTVESVLPLQHALFDICTEGKGPLMIELVAFEDTPFRVHWSSPLGQADQYEYRRLQLY